MFYEQLYADIWLYPALALIYAKLPWRSERSKSQVPKASAPEAAEGLINILS